MALGLALVAPTPAHALTLEPIGEFQRPSYVASVPNDADRLLVSELRGRIVAVEDGTESTVLDLTGMGLLTAQNASGLLSFATAPDFETTGHLFVAYSRAAIPGDPGLEFDLQVDRFTVDGGEAAVASRRPLLTVPVLTDISHAGGQLQFGPDGMLYISTGDGGEVADTFEAGQDPDDLRAKILRIDPRAAGPGPYGIPPGNPYAGETPGADEVWSLGLRNPWRFSFDRATGDVWIGEVGEKAWEEVNFGAAPEPARGANFGWDCRQGTDIFEPADCLGTFVDPVFAYPHQGTTSASIAGGYVVRDPTLGPLEGRYLYGETVADEIRSIDPFAPGGPDDRFEATVDTPVSFGEDACGRLYVVSLHGEVSRLVGDGDACDLPPPAPPTVPADPPSQRCAGRYVTVIGTTGTDLDDVIVGEAGPDRIRGGAGNDVVCAGQGADRLRGGAGDDVLRGGPGRDRCRGGGGHDRFRSCRPVVSG
jgi:glucose/arabinose dehydrogenase